MLGLLGAVVPAATDPDGLAPVLVYFPLCAAGIVALVGAARRLRAADPGSDTGWWWVAGGFAVWLVGDVVHLSTAVAGTAGAESSAAPAYLAAYVPLAVGLLLLARRASSREQRRGAVLEGAVVSASLALLGLVFAVGPALAATTADRAAQLVDVAYAAGDVLLVALAALLLVVPHPRPLALVAAAATLPLVLVSDCAWLLVPESAHLDWLLTSSILLCHLAWAAAASEAAARAAGAPVVAGEREASETHGLSVRRLAVLAVAGALPVVVLGLVTHPPRPDGQAWVVVSAVALGALVSVLVVLRLAEALRAVRGGARAVELLRRDLEHRATHDALTGLADRSRSRSVLAAALTGPARTSSGVGLLFVDLDGFKAVNDTHGHRAGDDVLRVTATRARGAVRATDLVGRLGGDEFVVVLPCVRDGAELLDVAHRLLAELSRPLEADGHLVTVGASIGAALAPAGVAGDDAGAAADALLHEADTAVYRAKAQGRSRVVVFDDALRAAEAERSAVEGALRVAVQDDQLVLHHQPVVDLATGSVVAVEALVRWDRPGRGLVPPGESLLSAAGSDLVCDLGRWVLRAALRQQAVWARSAPDGRGPVVQVSLGLRHIARSSVLGDVAAALAECGADPASLLLQVTETDAVGSAAVQENLRALRVLGVRTAVDRFGSGWTSMGQLQHLLCDVLKLDRGLVTRSGPGTEELVALAVRAGHAFGMQVVAAGVETPEQADTVRAAGADHAQGWLWSRAVPAAELDHLFTGAVLPLHR